MPFFRSLIIVVLLCEMNFYRLYQQQNNFTTIKTITQALRSVIQQISVLHLTLHFRTFIFIDFVPALNSPFFLSDSFVLVQQYI